jgi:glycosyltransferase involved in cell wall biosynthesis
MLSVVIPALNSASTISRTLSSIFSNKFPPDLFEVLVVDNGSSDNTVQIASEFSVKVFHCSKRGIGPPRNLGIKMAKGKVVCLTDSDCVVESDWLEKINEFFERNPEADGVGGPVLPYSDNQNKVQRLTGELFVEDQGYPEEVRKVEFGSFAGMIFGSNCAYKKEVVVSAGGFSEPGGSNLELVWRLVRMRRNLFFNPQVRTWHIFPWSLNGVMKQQFRWGSQLTHMQRLNGLRKKNLMDIGLVPYFVGRRLLSLLSSRNLEKEAMHLLQLTSFSLGQIHGYAERATSMLSVIGQT